jgi:hypothetical protein
MPQLKPKQPLLMYRSFVILEFSHSMRRALDVVAARYCPYLM